MRSRALGLVSNLLTLGVGVRRGVPNTSPEVRWMWLNEAATDEITFNTASPTSLVTDNSPGDNSTFIQQALGSGDPVYLGVIYDLKSPKIVTRFRRRIGTANGNTYPNQLEYFDGQTNQWVNAFTGLYMGTVGSGSFAWEPELDSTQVVSTPRRYWRTVIADEPATNFVDARIGDFRLYTADGIVL